MHPSFPPTGDGRPDYFFVFRGIFFRCGFRKLCVGEVVLMEWGGYCDVFTALMLHRSRLDLSSSREQQRTVERRLRP